MPDHLIVPNSRTRRPATTNGGILGNLIYGFEKHLRLKSDISILWSLVLDHKMMLNKYPEMMMQSVTTPK